MAGASVEGLWRGVFPQARSLGGTATLARPVAWVRVLKARTPAFDALDADDLALVPVSALANLAAIGVDASSVVDAVSAAAGCGLLVVGDAGDSHATTVVAAAAQRQLAVLALADGDIGALERSAISFIVNARAELDARAAVLEGELEQAALSGLGPVGLAAVISRFFGRPVAIEADDGSVLAAHSGADSVAAAPSVASYLRNRRGGALRVPLPASGTLVLLGTDEPSELERVACSRIAPFLALALTSAPSAANGGRARPPSERLPADGPPWVVLVARQLDSDDGTDVATREATRTALRQLATPRRLQLRGDATSLEHRLVYAPPPSDQNGIEFAARVSHRLGRPVAVSDSFAVATERALREAAARSTLEALEALPSGERQQLAASGGTVLRADLLPALRLMAGLNAIPDASRHARALLQPLLTGRPGRDAHVLATLRAVLDHAGMADAAAALGIHRNTLAYRLAAIERRTGWQMSDPLVRFGLALAVRFMQNDQYLAT